MGSRGISRRGGNDFLTCPFFEEEIKAALFQMEKKIRLLALTACLLNSFKVVGK